MVFKVTGVWVLFGASSGRIACGCVSPAYLMNLDPSIEHPAFLWVELNGVWLYCECIWSPIFTLSAYSELVSACECMPVHPCQEQLRCRLAATRRSFPLHKAPNVQEEEHKGHAIGPSSLLWPATAATSKSWTSLNFLSYSPAFAYSVHLFSIVF